MIVLREVRFHRDAVQPFRLIKRHSPLLSIDNEIETLVGIQFDTEGEVGSLIINRTASDTGHQFTEHSIDTLSEICEPSKEECDACKTFVSGELGDI